jgi:hypothetical protein
LAFESPEPALQEAVNPWVLDFETEKPALMKPRVSPTPALQEMVEVSTSVFEIEQLSPSAPQ